MRRRRTLRSGRTVSKAVCIYRDAPNGEEVEIEVEVEGMVNPYWPGDYNNPPEGGDVEDLQALFWDDSAKKYRDVPLTDDEVNALSEELAMIDAETCDDGYDDRDRGDFD